MDLRLTVDSVRGVWAIMPTPATPDADDPARPFTVDLEETRRAVEALIRDGVDAIMTNGTFGEAATLTDEEWRAFVRTVLETAQGRIPVCIGTTTLSTRGTIERAIYARDLGAHGMLLGRPMWCELSPDAIVTFYQDVAQAVPELGIVVYDNPEAFKGRLSPSVYGALARIPQVVAAKYMAVDGVYRACMKAVEGRIRLMPLEADWYAAAQWFPEEALACWSGSASCDPLPVVRLRDALRTGDMQRAGELSRRIEWTFERFFPEGSFHLFSLYNVPLEKERMNAAGYIHAGPSRPPYHVVPQEYVAAAREAGERWRRLAEELRHPDDSRTA